MSKTDNTPNYQRKEWLLENYVNADRTANGAGELAGVAGSTISSWVRRHGISPRQREVDLSDVEIPETKPWKDGELLETLYIDKQLSSTEISGILDCSGNSVLKGLKEHGVEVRDNSTAMTNSYNNLGHASYYIHKRSSRPVWKSGDDEVFVYRLLAVAEYGFDAVCDHDVHHINGIRWDTRPDNIEVLTPEEHQARHRKIDDDMERQRIAELYEHGDLASRPLAEWLDHDITASTVLDIHKEFFPD